MNVMGDFIVDNVDKISIRSVDICEWEAVSAYAYIEFLKRNGFYNIVSLLKNKSGKPYLRKDDKLYVAMEEFYGENLKLRNIDEGTKAAKILAQFHNAGEGFIPPSGVKVRAFWGKNSEKYRMLTVKLEKYIDYIKEKKNLNEFEICTLEYTNSLLLQCKECMKIFRSPIYINALEKSMKKRELCINEISGGTFRSVGEDFILSKVFDIGYNMIEEDISQLIRRVIKEEDILSYKDILNEYKYTKNISVNSETIIKALVSFPVDSVKLISKYFDDMRDLESMVKKFIKSIENDKKTYILEV